MTTFRLRTRGGEQLGETSAPIVWVPGDVIPRDGQDLRIVAVYSPAGDCATGTIIVEHNAPKQILVTSSGSL